MGDWSLLPQDTLETARVLILKQIYSEKITGARLLRYETSMMACNLSIGPVVVELIQIDGGDHRWFECQAPACTLSLCR
jgi:hypothetical protein